MHNYPQSINTLDPISQTSISLVKLSTQPYIPPSEPPRIHSIDMVPLQVSQTKTYYVSNYYTSP